MEANTTVYEEVQPTESPLSRLRQIRDMLDKMDLLKAERDRLIREAAGRIYSHRQIGVATGLSAAGVSHIIHKSAAKPSKRRAPENKPVPDGTGLQDAPEKEQTSPVGITLAPPTPSPPIMGAMRAPTCVCGAGASDGEGHCLQCSKPLAEVLA